MRADRASSVAAPAPKSVTRVARAVLGVGLALMAFSAALAEDHPALPDNPLLGRLLFESKRCNQCHGIAGLSLGVAPSLGEGRFRGSFLDLGAALWNHVPGMRERFEGSELAWPQMTAVEALELTSFLYYLDYLGRPGDAGRGANLFKAKACGACHEVGGKGSGRAGPDLAELKRFASPLFVAQAIWNHGPKMLETLQHSKIKPPTFQEGDLADLSAFIRQAAQAGPQEHILIAPGNPNAGRALFAAKGCASCHPVRGVGGGSGPDLAHTSLHRPAEAIADAMWNHAFAMAPRMEQAGIGWPHLTTPELADLIAYLYFIPFSDPPGDASRGAEVFATRSCATCHAGGNEAAHHGPALAGSPAANSPEALVAAMWNHAPVMKEAILGEGRPWPELTGAELRDLLAYLRSRSTAR
ncbi:MAG: c-type cytochrome [Thermoanaerobaculales bacterium]